MFELVADDTYPGACAIIDEKGRSVLAVHNGTPIFATRDIAELVLKTLNENAEVVE